MRSFLVLLVLALSACGGGGAAITTAAMQPPAQAPQAAQQWPDSISVVNPSALPAHLSAQRVPVGVTGDYKPNIVLRPDGELLLVMFEYRTNSDGTYQEDMILYRSEDGGQTWGSRNVLMPGREPYLTQLSDGTLLLTSTLLLTDYRNTEGYTYAVVYRSVDDGITWDAGMKILAADAPGGTPTITSRNVLELADGSLLLGVGAGASPEAEGTGTIASYMWRSYDKGMSWQKSASLPLPTGFAAFAPNWLPWTTELVFEQAPNGDIIGFSRAFTLTPGDQNNKLVMLRSTDSGATWAAEGNVGVDGEMYPSLLRLADGRELFTYTVRALQPQLGVRAALATWAGNSLSISSNSDEMMVDTQTPAGQPSGGGFGNTVQLADGTLVTAYSYRASDGNTYAEVVRWQL